MKFSIVFLCVCVSVLCGGVLGGPNGIDHAIVEKCGKEFNITPESMKDMKNTKIADINASDDLKCFSKCLITSSSILKDKKVDMEAVKKLYAELPPNVQATIDKCKDVYKGADTCDEAWDMFKCYYSDME